MPSDQISYLVGQVDIGRLRAHVSQLADGERHSLYSPARHAESTDYISAAFEDCGLETRQHTFDLHGRRGINVLAHQAGASDREVPPLLVSAHYDTVRGSPGADDNASGVATLLECARVLSMAKLNRGVEYAAFDMEKQPGGGSLAGSRAFVKDIRRKGEGVLGEKRAYEGVYNLEMVGYRSGAGTQGHPAGSRFILPRAYKWAQQRGFRGDFIASVAQGPGVRLGQSLHEAARRWVPELEVLPVNLRHRIPIMPEIFRGDHAPFWMAGIPAIMITDTANFRNPHYHRPTDTADTLDYDFMGDVTRALIATLALSHSE